MTTRVTVPKDSEMLYFETTLTNHTENNRLRVLFPTDSPEDSFYTRTPFDFVKWDVAHEDDTHRVESDTRVHPSQGISRIGGDDAAVALYSKGLYEIKVTENQERALALTLFRAAESETGTAHPEDIKMQRTMAFHYALSLSRQSGTQTLIQGEQYRTGIRDFLFRQNEKAETFEGSMSFLQLGDCEKIVSHISGEGKHYCLRLYDVSGREETVTVKLPYQIARMDYVNLKGDVLVAGEAAGKEAKITCPAHKIVTVCLEIER